MYNDSVWKRTFEEFVIFVSFIFLFYLIQTVLFSKFNFFKRTFWISVCHMVILKAISELFDSISILIHLPLGAATLYPQILQRFVIQILMEPLCWNRIMFKMAKMACNVTELNSNETNFLELILIRCLVSVLCCDSWCCILQLMWFFFVTMSLQAKYLHFLSWGHFFISMMVFNIVSIFYFRLTKILFNFSGSK